MGLIPEEIIETVRLRSDIVEVVSRYVQLKKAGKNHLGLCPFHHEKTPSFTVSQDKQFFHCFGCKVGGNVFRFLMLKENLTFSEAVTVLAQRAGVAIPVSDSPAWQEKDLKRKGLKQANNLARDFFRQVLQRHDAAAPARQYLAGRGLTPEVLERFQIGFAPPGWTSLLDHLGKKGYRPQELVEAGLVIKNEAGRYYDRFRSRVMFPIWDTLGQVVGFGGRVLDDSQPKYLNTPETSFFSKGRTLYGLHLARQPIREKGRVIIVEGYMDVITAHRHGVTNTVASLGTALTAEHGKLLLNYSRDIIIAYDSDTAGVAATIRGLDLLLELGCQVRVITMPDGKDPDDFLSKHGPGPWEELIDRAYTLIEYKLQQAAARGHVKTVADKTEVMRQVFPGLAAKSGVQKEEDLKTIARVLNLSWETVAGEFKRFEENLGKKWTNPDNIAKNTHTIIRKGEKLDARGKAEAVLLRLVLENPARGYKILAELGEEPFRNQQYMTIFKHCLEAGQHPEYRPEGMFSTFENEGQNILSYILTLDIPGDNPDKIMYDYIRSVNRCARHERREELLRQIRAAEKSGNDFQHQNLLRELVFLKNIDEAEKARDFGRVRKLTGEYKQIFCFDTESTLERGGTVHE
ncbi:DNA primase [Pelotomaculum propionicicum]|uniref:DNA primase n=1 Tax=Pelotomaculum propionicicum TaxID=258475 RepID=A0A4Y7RTI3_9FIRM|nr:DNA primase [Pelotomaculum propionicicum]TEB11557.1 DNA primase [Pelotomaculum propionicicum]